ncbi:ABC transporter substrate-binding protein [Thermocoleostomius sinensis]|uniref:ABC transporter substrate-binding protein n=1 Tax=Thermocoleostomius sinensis A174 TaxID=2016057 RepID=A0A9E8ZEI4_9CYAN|nr:ABC transporter substrate-binding protein [Thermocoleostomius sinensis]WAL60357.1 ABC transporter substrate-binding protein [Thermocoleostomius sinensis A174]
MTATTGELYRATDATGTEIRLNQPAERIVCFTATGIDILAELGLASVGYLSQGIADYPESYGDRAQQFTAIGFWMLPNLKTIRQLQPDLILGWRFPYRFYQHWLRQMAPTYLMSGSGYNPALARLRDVAQLTGRITEAETAIQQLESQLQTYRTIIYSPSQKDRVNDGRLYAEFAFPSIHC